MYIFQIPPHWWTDKNAHCGFNNISQNTEENTETMPALIPHFTQDSGNIKQLILQKQHKTQTYTRISVQIQRAGVLNLDTESLVPQSLGK